MNSRTKKAVWIFSFAAVAAAITGAVRLSVSRAGDSAVVCTTYAMGTCFSQTVAGENAREAENTASAAISEMDNLISRKTETSEISELNRSAGQKSVPVGAQTASLLKLSLELAKLSGGAYDPTILPLSSLWDFDDDIRTVPEESKILAAVGLVDYSALQLDESAGTAFLAKSGMGVDLGGVGKGAACDAAVAAYEAAGVRCGLISAGGSSIGLFGIKTDGSLWRVAVRDPKTPDSDAGTVGELSLASGYLSTSGVYERCFEQDGILYHHLLNPKTGYPQNNGLLSVTVTASGGALSDGLSTACFMLGIEKSAALLEHYGAGAVFICEDGSIYVTENLRGSFQITNSAYSLAED